MRALILFALLACTTWPAQAETIDADAIVSAVTGDLDKDGAADLVMLVRGEDGMDLQLFLQVPDQGYLRHVETVRGKIWGAAGPDAMAGQTPQLSMSPNGSVRILTRNDAIGRDRWEQVLTLAYRNTDLIVAGFTYRWRDTLELDNSGDCDLNVLTGKGIANLPDGGDATRAVKVDAAPAFVPFKDWDDRTGLEACRIPQ